MPIRSLSILYDPVVPPDVVVCIVLSTLLLALILMLRPPMSNAPSEWWSRLRALVFSPTSPRSSATSPASPSAASLSTAAVSALSPHTQPLSLSPACGAGKLSPAPRTGALFPGGPDGGWAQSDGWETSGSAHSRGGGSHTTSALSPGGGMGAAGVTAEEVAVVKVRGFHSLARECVERAVSAEERGKGSKAVAYYRKALEIIHEGLGAGARRYVRAWVAQLEAGRRSRGSVVAGEQLVPLIPCAAPLSSHALLLFSPLLSPPPPFPSPRASTSPEVRRCHADLTRWSADVTQRLSVLLHSHSASPPAQHRGGKPALGGAAGGRDGGRSGGGKEGASVGGVDAQLVAVVEGEIVDARPSVRWDDIVGLEGAKQALQEMVILPALRSDLFQGIRRPPRGLLLYGPPGNGKTMLAKAVAAEARATFFNISAATLTSKWMGESEKLVRALFAVAAQRQPSIIFIDEIDSVLSARAANEHEASRRLKTEFLLQFDGVLTAQSDHVVVIGATNRPQELDEAVLRRLVKRIFIPLPDAAARSALLRHLTRGRDFALSDADMQRIVSLTQGYSASDLKALCQEAAMGPIRELGGRIATASAHEVRAVRASDMHAALSVIRATCSPDRLEAMHQWSVDFGAAL
ncbi:unnamed protein product [Closterium sp. Naga37s-1]|nr:unnamed protein product [Closterium sp. Naga37s-1]